jgi:hypothetical protein
VAVQAANVRSGEAFPATSRGAGKRLRVRRSSDLLSPPGDWQTLSDEVLTQPEHSFADPSPPADRAFYGVEWVK